MKKIISAIFLFTTLCCTFVNGIQQVPCYYIFGNSLSDAGNNNNLITELKANYPPYGVDFPGQISTGRFTNGLTPVDFITELLGFNSLIKPSRSSNITNQDILRGLNFASSGSGILDTTGITMGDRISFSRQLENFVLIIARLQLLIQEPVGNYLSKCLFTVDFGINDYVNYFMPQNYLQRNLVNPDIFTERLVAQYKLQLQALYKTGARKIAVLGVPNIGCLIIERTLYNQTQCVEKINQASVLFNNKVAQVIDDFNSNLPGAQFTFFNITGIQDSVPSPGIITNSPCCKINANFFCEPNSTPCANRNMYEYFDGYHPTQFIYKLLSTIIFTTINPSFAHPKNIIQLVQS